MSKIADDILMHYGIKRRSGRYPYGSGENPYQHEGNFYTRVNKLRDEEFEWTDPETGKKYTGDTAIAKSMGLSTTQFRAEYSLAREELRSEAVAMAKSLSEKGYSPTEIAKKMGYANESSVRNLLNQTSEARMNVAKATAEQLRSEVNSKGMIDVGTGVEKYIGVSKEKLEEALYILRKDGYEVYSGRVPQATNPGKYTTIKVLCPPGTEHKEIYNYENVHSMDDIISYDGGESFHKSFIYPSSMDSKRLGIVYGDEGGKSKDGLMEIRRGVADLDLGDSHYAQVRILVDGTHYLKGMAIYSDNLPEGKDVVFYTNKQKGSEVLKPISDNPDNPFKSLIKENGGQSFYDDPNGKYVDPKTGKNQSLSLINKRSEEGDWGNWSNNLPSQFLSKQPMSLINKQLNLAIADKEAEYEKIKELTNPTVKKNLLDSFANECDSSAVHLNAAALPRQSYQVLIPLTSIKDNEVYAPNYHDGETVALIRYPHAGTFEIPILKVNNKQEEGQKVLGNTPKDAIGVNMNVAQRLSGADFDGDTVMVIPCNSARSKVHIESRSPLKDLEGFDPSMEYGGRPEGTYKKLSEGAKQNQMGIVSNLITDMTLKGADEDELARAVKHSMVIIDANKHDLDYRRSEADNGITALRRKYQGSVDEDGRFHTGASTLISRASAETDTLKRKGSRRINPDTGEQYYEEVREEYVDKNGKTRVRTQKTTQMEKTPDAYSLVSEARTPQEMAYASYANKMKALANDARKEMLNTKDIKYNANSKKIYTKEVESLDKQLSMAQRNAPRERQAQLIANSKVKAKTQENPDMSKSEIRKYKQQALTNARNQVGAKRTTITISDREWEAIQAGAVSASKLTQILKYADTDAVRQRATPRSNNKSLGAAQVNRINSMKAAGYTIDQIAQALGISTSTVSKYLK